MYNQETLQKLTGFFEQYLDVNEALYENGSIAEDVLPYLLRYMVEKEVFRRESLRQAVLKQCGVILPHNLFEE